MAVLLRASRSPLGSDFQVPWRWSSTITAGPGGKNGLDKAVSSCAQNMPLQCARRGSPFGTCVCSPLTGSNGQAQSVPLVQSSNHGRSRQYVRLTQLEWQAWKLSGWSPDQLQRRSLRVIAKANDSMADDSIPSEMSLESALKLLGVHEGASFEEILGAKKTLVDSSSGDQERIAQVEAAYDMLLMQSLSQRRAGKVVDNTIRYADVRKAKPASVSIGGAGPEWLRNVLVKAPVQLETPSPSVFGTQTGVYGALVVWMYVSGLTSPSVEGSLTGGADVPGLILAIGFGASLYFLRKQNLRLGKATIVTIAGLVAGAVVGGVVESWLHVDIVPVLGIGSPVVVVSEFVLFSLWFSSLYLR